MPPKVVTAEPHKVIPVGKDVYFYHMPTGADNPTQWSWLIGKVDSYEASTKTYTCTGACGEKDGEDKVTHKINITKNPKDIIVVSDIQYLNEDVDDLLMLVELHEGSLLHCLRRRFLDNRIYTNIGQIVIACNPFTFEIPAYKDDKMINYLNEGIVIEKNLPHTWAITHNTYWEMRENRHDQTILISGESGAGKTEGAKIVVKYVGILSTMRGTQEQKSAVEKVNKRIAAASPILEGFGNAKTVRNDNSSRFGKFLRIQFDKNGFLVGAHATKYLLEKSRIITAAQNERVYHSFYLLCAGADAKNYVGAAKAYKSINSGNCIEIDGVDDGGDYAKCQEAFTEVGVAETEQKAIWSCVAGILWSQNVEFEEKEVAMQGKVAKLDPDSLPSLERAAEYWGINRERIEQEFLTTTLKPGMPPKFLTRVQAIDIRDTTSRAVYEWVFDELFVRINATTDAKNVGQDTEHFIGLLDIFGFEDFQVNSFEQLCINLANETLQEHYNHFIFTMDMKECEEEGIDVSSVVFEDNKACLDLLANGKSCIFNTLDDVCRQTSDKTTDLSFLELINQNFLPTKTNKGNPYMLPIAVKKDQKPSFKIRHYAGDVTYDVEGFLEKNRDNLKNDIRKIFHETSIDLLRKLVPPLDDPTKAQKKPSVSEVFKKSLKDLMDLINATNPHWIRCIKSTPRKKPGLFHTGLVMNQLRSAGVLETVKIRANGYPIRFKIDKFVDRYRILIPLGAGEDIHTLSLARSKEAITALFKELQIGPEIGQLGHTKVFLRNAAFLMLNHEKDAKTVKYAVVFQAVGRARKVREELTRRYIEHNRERLEAEMRKRREEEEKRRREQELLEAKRLLEMEEYERKMKVISLQAAVLVQRHVRGYLTRCWFYRHFLDAMRAEAERKMDEADLYQRRRLAFAFDHFSAVVIRDRKEVWAEAQDRDKESHLKVPTHQDIMEKRERDARLRAERQARVKEIKSIDQTVELKVAAERARLRRAEAERRKKAEIEQVEKEQEEEKKKKMKLAIKKASLHMEEILAKKWRERERERLRAQFEHASLAERHEMSALAVRLDFEDDMSATHEHDNLQTSLDARGGGSDQGNDGAESTSSSTPSHSGLNIGGSGSVVGGDAASVHSLQRQSNLPVDNITTSQSAVASRLRELQAHRAEVERGMFGASSVSPASTLRRPRRTSMSKVTNSTRTANRGVSFSPPPIVEYAENDGSSYADNNSDFRSVRDAWAKQQDLNMVRAFMSPNEHQNHHHQHRL